MYDMYCTCPRMYIHSSVVLEDAQSMYVCCMYAVYTYVQVHRVRLHLQSIPEIFNLGDLYPYFSPSVVDQI